jgi:glycosyltransferase involved in cell wall biosynthesis
MISVIMPVYNSASTIKRAIDSILCQTYSDFELLIYDSGSSDGTIEIINGYSDKRIRLFVEPGTIGMLGDSLTKLIKGARGEYIARMDSDDISHSDRFEVQLGYFANNPSLVLLGTQCNIIFGESLPIRKAPFPTFHKEILHDLARGIFSLAHPTVMFKKADAQAIGYYAVKGIAEDLQFYFDMSRVGQIMNTDEVLFSYSISINSLSGSKQRFIDSFYRYTIFKYKKSDIQLTYDDFIKSWYYFPFWTRFSLKIAHLGNNLYKTYLRNKNKNRFSLLLLLLAALLKPQAATRNILRFIRD